MYLTDYHAKYFARELMKRCPSDSLEKLASALVDAQVDLNPHQVEAALFMFKSPLSKGAIFTDEVGRGKTIEAGGFLTLWTRGRADDALHGRDWAWLTLDGAMTNAPLGGKMVGKNPTDRGTTRTKRRVLTDGSGVPVGSALAGPHRCVCLGRYACRSQAERWERPSIPERLSFPHPTPLPAGEGYTERH
jgi:hypothetical protein